MKMKKNEINKLETIKVMRWHFSHFIITEKAMNAIRNAGVASLSRITNSKGILFFLLLLLSTLHCDSVQSLWLQLELQTVE